MMEFSRYRCPWMVARPWVVMDPVMFLQLKREESDGSGYEDVTSWVTPIPSSPMIPELLD